MTAVIGAPCLEERAADARQVVGADANAGVFHHDQDIGGFDGDGNRDAAAAVGEFHGVRNQVEQDLLEGALVRGDLRQIRWQRMVRSSPDSRAFNASRSQQLPITWLGANGSGEISKSPVSIFDMSGCR